MGGICISGKSKSNVLNKNQAAAANTPLKQQSKNTNQENLVKIQELSNNLKNNLIHFSQTHKKNRRK